MIRINIQIQAYHDEVLLKEESTEDASGKGLEYASFLMDTYGIGSSIGSGIVHVVNDTIPRLVASALTAYIGVCCGYVGLVHLGFVMPK